ncbi:hypothetical protein [Microcoleus sp. N9_A1]|uniref:hypothetical protein n=1 Tax=Microcoleus sp. N9_A1 TaxID=3055380 RepID=UPI002FD0CD2E
MAIRIPNKNGKFPNSDPDPQPKSELESEPSNSKPKESMFAKFTAKLAWEIKNIEPELDELFPYYKDYCFIFLTPHCDEEYVGEGYGTYRDCLDKYDEIGRRLAKMWPIDQVTEDRKINHNSRGK